MRAYISIIKGGIRGLTSVLLARAVAASGGLVLSYALAQNLGTEGLGRFVFVFSVVGFLAIVSRLGFDVSLIRTISQEETLGNHQELILYLLHSLKLTFYFSIAIALIGVVLIVSAEKFLGSDVIAWWLIVSLPGITLLMVVSGYLKARRMASVAALVEIGGVSFVTGVMIFAEGVIITGISLANCIEMFLVGVFILTVCAIWFSVFDAKQRSGSRSSLILNSEKKSILSKNQNAYIVIAASGFITQAGSFALSGPFLTEADVGLLRVVERIALTISFGATVVSPIIAPRVVRFYVEKNYTQIKKLIAKGILASFVLSVPPAIAVFYFSVPILNIFGNEFVGGVNQLRILAAVNMIVAVLSPISMVINMTDGERLLMRMSILVLIFGGISFPFGTYLFGVNGFLSVYCFAALIPNIATCIIAFRKLKVSGNNK